MSSDKNTTRKELSRTIGVREDVISASKIPEQRITELYNEASKGDWWRNNVAKPGLVITIGSFLLDIFVNTPTVDQAAGTAFFAGLLMWIGGDVMAAKNKLPAMKEVRDAADDRLVALDRKDRRGPRPS